VQDEDGVADAGGGEQVDDRPPEHVREDAVRLRPVAAVRQQQLRVCPRGGGGGRRGAGLFRGDGAAAAAAAVIDRDACDGAAAAATVVQCVSQALSATIASHQRRDAVCVTSIVSHHCQPSTPMRRSVSREHCAAAAAPGRACGTRSAAC
jgi:hypothetical protein